VRLNALGVSSSVAAGVWAVLWLFAIDRRRFEGLFVSET